MFSQSNPGSASCSSASCGPLSIIHAIRRFLAPIPTRQPHREPQTVKDGHFLCSACLLETPVEEKFGQGSNKHRIRVWITGLQIDGTPLTGCPEHPMCEDCGPHWVTSTVKERMSKHYGAEPRGVIQCGFGNCAKDVTEFALQMASALRDDELETLIGRWMEDSALGRKGGVHYCLDCNRPAGAHKEIEVDFAPNETWGLQISQPIKRDVMSGYQYGALRVSDMKKVSWLRKIAMPFNYADGSAAKAGVKPSCRLKQVSIHSKRTREELERASETDRPRRNRELEPFLGCLPDACYPSCLIVPAVLDAIKRGRRNGHRARVTFVEDGTAAACQHCKESRLNKLRAELHQPNRGVMESIRTSFRLVTSSLASPDSWCTYCSEVTGERVSHRGPCGEYLLQRHRKALAKGSKGATGLAREDQNGNQRFCRCPYCKCLIERQSGCTAMICGKDAHGGTRSLYGGCGRSFDILLALDPDHDQMLSTTTDVLELWRRTGTRLKNAELERQQGIRFVTYDF